MAAGVLRVRSSSTMRSSLLSTSSRRRRIRERLLVEVMDTNLIRNARMRPQPPLLAGASVRRPSASCPGEWQEALSLPNLRAEHPLVAQTPSLDLFICAKDLLAEAIMVLEKPSSLLTEHDGLIHFEEDPLDRRLR